MTLPPAMPEGELPSVIDPHTLSEIKPFPGRVKILDTYVAGMYYVKALELKLEGIKKGDVIKLLRAPNNEYDTMAIEVHYNGNRIGFIPADSNEVVANLMDAGKHITCYVKATKFLDGRAPDGNVYQDTQPEVWISLYLEEL